MEEKNLEQTKIEEIKEEKNTKPVIEKERRIGIIIFLSIILILIIGIALFLGLYDFGGSSNDLCQGDGETCPTAIKFLMNLIK